MDGRNHFSSIHNGLTDWPIPKLKEWLDIVHDPSLKDTSTCRVVNLDRKGVREGLPGVHVMFSPGKGGMGGREDSD